MTLSETKKLLKKVTKLNGTPEYKACITPIGTVDMDAFKQLPIVKEVGKALKEGGVTNKILRENGFIFASLMLGSFID